MEKIQVKNEPGFREHGNLHVYISYSSFLLSPKTSVKTYLRNKPTKIGSLRGERVAKEFWRLKSKG